MTDEPIRDDKPLDAHLATVVRQRAAELVEAVNEAVRAGLMVDIRFVKTRGGTQMENADVSISRRVVL